MPSDILIQPNRGSTTLNPIIFFSGSAANNSIRLETLPSGSVSFLGKSGSLFSIVDSMSGSLMAVSDISGLPILEVFSDDKVVMGKFNSNTLVVTGSNVGIGKSAPNSTLDVNGTVVITGSTEIQASLSGDNYYQLKVKSINSNFPAGLYLTGNNNATTYMEANGSGVSGTLLGVTKASKNFIYTNPGALVIGTNSGDAIYFSTGSVAVTINTAGNVGIGTTNPNAKLDVNGNTIITGSLIVTGDVQADFTQVFMLMGA